MSYNYVFVTMIIAVFLIGIKSPGLRSKCYKEQSCVNAHELFITHNVRIMFQTFENPNQSHNKKDAIQQKIKVGQPRLIPFIKSFIPLLNIIKLKVRVDTHDTVRGNNYNSHRNSDFCCNFSGFQVHFIRFICSAKHFSNLKIAEGEKPMGQVI